MLAGKPSSSHDEKAKPVHSSTANSYGLSMVTESPLLSSKPKALQSTSIQSDAGGLLVVGSAALAPPPALSRQPNDVDVE